MARCHDACFYASINSHLTFAAWLNSNANFSPKKKQVERQMKSWRQARRHAKEPDPPPTLGRKGKAEGLGTAEDSCIGSQEDVRLSRDWSSKEGRRADALALGADERRDKLRKAAGRSTYPVIRGCLNGETRLGSPQPSMAESIGHGGEPGELKHLSTRRKRKKHRFRQ